MLTYLLVILYRTLSSQVTNSTAAEDFFSRNVVVAFADGVTTASATLLLVTDVIPEGKETFIVQITSTRLGAEIGRQNTMELVVRANDEPYGQFQFSQVCQVFSVLVF